ncbi:MAG: hypothetical protein DRP86_03225 [Candidatus Neomarinimicrobiota bacterium]|nr:SH3 domain-containing protein [Candidatus Neomarinimicrobiota bacterium]RKY50654.1 MAG: hypothetical protein DRP86_03225 [Candidatus Neomarinimicrobiota bacterium]
MKAKYALYAAIFAVIITFLVNVFQKDRRIYEAEPYASVIIEDADLMSNHRWRGASDDWVSRVVGQVSAGTPVQVMEGHSEWYKILMDDGTMGWIHENHLKPSEKVLVREVESRTIDIWDKPETAGHKVIGEVRGRKWVTRLEESPKALNKQAFTRIRTEDGKEGWVFSYDLERIGWKQPRLIQRDEWRYNKKRIVKRWTGRPVEKFIGRYSEPHAIMIDDGRKIYFFNNLYLFNGHRKEIGTQVITENGNIQDFHYSARPGQLIGRFPLSATLRFPIIMNNLWHVFDLSYHKSYNRFGDRLSETIYNPPRWLSWILVILVVISFISLFYIILFVPYYISNKIAFSVSLNQKLANKIILLVAAISGIILGYIYFVFINVNIGTFNNHFFIHFLFVLGMTIGFISKWKSDLLYNRCSKCRNWSGSDAGSELVDKSEHTLTTTYSSGNKTVEHGTKEVWLDHRLCTNQECGHFWSIVRTRWSGWHR